MYWMFWATSENKKKKHKLKGINHLNESKERIKGSQQSKENNQAFIIILMFLINSQTMFDNSVHLPEIYVSVLR